MLRKLFWLLAVFFVVGGAIGYYGYTTIFGKNVSITNGSKELYILPGSTLEDVMDSLSKHNILENTSSFRKVAKLMKYGINKIPSGRYLIKDGMNNRQLIGKLRSGNQDAIKVTFNNIRKIENLAGALDPYFFIDSLTLINHFLDPEFLAKNEVNKDNVLTLFIPNTYQMYWDSSEEEITNRLIKEKEKFWSQQDRTAHLELTGMTKSEVYSLASIVEKESNLSSERPIIAGLYLNRIRTGMPLQADPTVVFATGLFDLRRVLLKHLEYDSPFNTYKYAGIPPGPITMPSIQSIDAVLKPQKHDYFYMCSKPGYGTEHVFAESIEQHERNANKYRRWLDKEGIR